MIVVVAVSPCWLSMTGVGLCKMGMWLGTWSCVAGAVLELAGTGTASIKQKFTESKGPLIL